MSLFKAREWWSCQVGSGEEFDYGCLKVGSFTENPNHKIVVGSHQGILRIFNPSGSHVDSMSNNNASDLLLEKNLGMPIIQIEIGKFVSSSPVNQIAVLFSHKLSIYDYVEQAGVTEHGRQFDLELNYEHNMNRPTFNMCKGQFGSGGRGNKESSDCEYICVQTLDGVLFVFEYERQTMIKSLPHTYLPGPICYLSRSDAIATVSSNYHVECYKYQALAIASGTDHGSSSNNDARRKGLDIDPSLSVSQSSKKVLPEWSFNLGECALGIQTTQRIRNASQTILVLGERNLFCLTDNGQLLFMSKFEYNPSTFIVYNSEVSQSDTSNPGVRYIIGTHSRTLFIAQDGHIRWAAHVDSVPVQIEVATIQNIRGMICTLSETGLLQCCYLGTDPVSTSIPTIMSSTMINIGEAEEQLTKLNKQIKQAMNDPTLVVKRKANAQVTIQIDDTNQFSTTDETRFQRHDVESTVPSSRVNIRVKSSEAIQNTLLTVHVHTPLCAQPNEIRMGHIGGISAIGTASIVFWMRDDLTPWNLEATFTVSYNTMSDNICHTIQKSYKLPVKLVARSYQQPISATIAGQCKITLGANKPVTDLSRVFPELSTGDSNQQQGLTVRFYGSVENVSILASSKSQKYRFQSDSLASIWLFSNLLIERLSASSSIDFEFGDPLPLNDYFSIIDRHYELRVECEQINSTLEISSKQFRAIQKRLLSKFKDKTPSLLDNLDILLENTNQQILALADRYEQSRYELNRCSHDLSCATKLICLLLKISVSLSNDNAQLLNAILSPVTSDDNEQGWEETVDAAVNYALRTVLARSKSTEPGSMPSTIGNSTATMDINKLKKRIQTLCERLEKGGSLVSSSSIRETNFSPDSAHSSTSLSTRKEKPIASNRRRKHDDDEDAEIPNGDHDDAFSMLPSTNARKQYNDEDDDN
ncbi:unnamed protein product [Rotaria magnacalcarata]|uniref:PTHB1 n=5 Tax=Rotaria magnacalcarata TaxID=392030 RepID=A0A819G3M2_9BILA|nr:unnamed protein product [Rotaria magnacalcarata]CAF2244971.1 unnamed protein product [Rotaria magnacalcarata]CAF3817318.1 unnamed protein product [Rotaria magnacalcarata]CAF3879679.1 unnamed protein product [Rotaria magnacalcarata]